MKQQQMLFSVSLAFWGLAFYSSIFFAKEQALTYRVYQGHVVFYDGQSETFYFVQYEKVMSFPDVLYFSEYDTEQGVLRLHDASGKTFVFDPNASVNYYGIYAVGSFSGKKYRKWVKKEKAGGYRLSEALQQLPCSCMDEAEEVDCQSGGKGAVGCSSSKGLFGKKKMCRVRCGGDHIQACCN